MYESTNIELEPLDIKQEYDYRSDASSVDYEQENGVCDDIDIKEEPLRVKQERCDESYDFTVALCDICRQYCVGAQELAAHRYTHTSDVTYTCLLCLKSCTNKAGLKRHFTTMHSSKRVNIATAYKYKCDICNKKFALKSNLTRHERIHTGEKPFECDVCRKGFNTEGNRKVHMYIHTGEKPYACHFCDYRSHRKVNITIHMRVHTGKKPFECDICHRQFRNTSDRTRHIRTHTGKPYVCNFCHKRFKNTSNCAIHMRAHTEENYVRDIVF